MGMEKREARGEIADHASVSHPADHARRPPAQIVQCHRGGRTSLDRRISGQFNGKSV